MNEYTEDQLFNMSDEDLEAAFNEVRDTEEVLEDEPEIEESEIVEDLEQPDEDEDSDDNSTDDEDGDEDEEDSEEDEGTLDGEPEEDEEKPVEEGVKSEKEVQPVNKEFKFKASGKEYEFTEKEIMEQFPTMFAKAQDYTRKMQALKPWRKTIDALETADLKHEDISLMIDVLKGDKEAVAEVLNRTGVDALEVNTDERNYVTKDYGRDADALEFADVIESIKDDPEYVTTHKILSKDWDDASWRVISSKPGMVKALHVDVKSGMFQKLQPIAEKIKLFSDGSKSDLDYYMEAAGQYQQKQAVENGRRIEREKAEQENIKVEKERVEKAKQNKSDRLATKTASKKRKAAGLPRKGTPAKKATDYLDAYDDESYFEWANKVENSN